MNKKAAPPVVAFLLLGGAFKMANNDIDVKNVVNYSHGEMKVNDKEKRRH
jgi:hypothetical protein